MAPQPRTIKDYKTALLRLGVPLPAGQVKLAQYAALYSEATAGAHESRSNLGDKTAHFINPNVPLSAQEATTPSGTPRTHGNVPLSMQSPRPHSSPARSSRMPAATPPPQTVEVVDHNSPAMEPATEPTDEQHITSSTLPPRTTAHRCRSRTARSAWLVAAALGAVAVAGVFVCCSSTLEARLGVSMSPLSVATLDSMPSSLLLVADTPPVGLSAEESFAGISSSLTVDHPTSPPPLINTLEAEADEKPETSSIVTTGEEVESEHSVSGKEAEMLTQPEQQTEKVEAAECVAEATVVEAHDEQLTELTEPDPVQLALDTSLNEAIEDAGVAASADGASPSDEAVLTAGRSDLAEEMTEDVDMADAHDATTAAEAVVVQEVHAEVVEGAVGQNGLLSTLLNVSLKVGRAAVANLRDGISTIASVGLGLAEQCARSERVRAMLALLLDAVCSLMSAMGSVGSAVGTAVLGLTLDGLKTVLPKIIEMAPSVSRRIFLAVLLRPDRLASLLTALGAFHFFRRAYRIHRRWRESRQAQRSSQVDAAARWIIGELRNHASRWTSISGAVHPLPPSELRAIVPHAVLADRALWPRVAERVRADMSVRVVPPGPNSSSDEEGWLFFAPVLSPPGYCTPTPMSPVMSPVMSPHGRRAVSPGLCRP